MIAYVIIGLAVLARFVPHVPNAAPITALAIFSAATLDWKKSVGLTLAARLVSDIFLGFFAWPLMAAVYISHLAGVLLGVWIRRSTTPSRRDIGTPLLSQEGNRPILPLKKGEYFAIAEGGGMNRWLKIFSSGIVAAAVFFLVTNFAFFYSYYPHTFAGIMQSYANGLPFLRGTLLGDVGYTLAMFGAYELAANRFKRKTLQPA